MKIKYKKKKPGAVDPRAGKNLGTLHHSPFSLLFYPTYTLCQDTATTPRQNIPGLLPEMTNSGGKQNEKHRAVKQL